MSMKWKARKETLNIGTMELSKVTFNEDYMEVSIDILNISDDLQAEINKSIEIAKVEELKVLKKLYGENFEKWNRNYKPEWSNKPVVIQYHYLSIVLEEGKPNRYSIETGFEDAEHDTMEATASTVVDLSEYENELKKAIITVLVEKILLGAEIKEGCHNWQSS